MKRFKYISVQLVLSAFILICIGCASSTKTAEMIALTAAHHVSAYEQEVCKKIKVANVYYNDVMDNVNSTIINHRENEQPREFKSEVDEFAKENLGKSFGEISPQIIAFMETSLSSWADREKQYTKLMNEMKSDLEKNQQTLATEKEKISLLKSKLTTLSEARSHKETLTLMVAYAGEVKSELDRLQESSNKANKAIEDTMKKKEDTMKKKKEKKKENENGKTDKADKDHGK